MKRKRRRPSHSYTKAGPVTVTYPDGAVLEYPAYKPHEYFQIAGEPLRGRSKHRYT